MGEILYVDDTEIKRSKSSFSIYPNEIVKYEGKHTKLNIDNLLLALQTRKHIMDALGYQVLNAVYLLNFSTSRQITEYLNIVKGINVTQNTVSKKLHNFNNLSIVTQHSFMSDENKEGTNMKFYCLEKNGRILLQGAGFTCNWKQTDALDNNVKEYLVRNQYILKLYKDCNKVENLKLKKLLTGIGATYTVNNNSHIIIPIRNRLNFEEDLLKTFDNLSKPEYLAMLNKKIIIIGEDAKHIFNIFKILGSKKLMQSNIYFITDLKLFDRHINKAFVRFGVKQNENGIDIVMKDEILNDFD